MKIGTSFSMCLASIHKGEVKISDIQFIITSTAYPSRDDMIRHVRMTMMGKAVEQHVANACILWDTGLIYQPSRRPNNRKATQLWFDVPDLFEMQAA